MHWLTVLGIAVGLAMDALAVAIATGLTVDRVTHRHVFRLAFHFGLFQFLMPVLGWLAGRQLAGSMALWDHWAAFGLLAGVGGKMLWEAWRNEEDRLRDDPTRGLTLVTLSVATSLDALAVGMSMALLGVSVWGPAVVIGLVAFTLTAVGILFGSRLGRGWGRWADALGGTVLMVIGTRILWSHLIGD
jgi:manganese efflux pump family protein